MLLLFHVCDRRAVPLTAQNEVKNSVLCEPSAACLPVHVCLCVLHAHTRMHVCGRRLALKALSNIVNLEDTQHTMLPCCQHTDCADCGMPASHA